MVVVKNIMPKCGPMGHGMTPITGITSHSWLNSYLVMTVAQSTLKRKIMQMLLIRITGTILLNP